MPQVPRIWGPGRLRRFSFKLTRSETSTLRFFNPLQSIHEPRAAPFQIVQSGIAKPRLAQLRRGRRAGRCLRCEARASSSRPPWFGPKWSVYRRSVYRARAARPGPWPRSRRAAPSRRRPTPFRAFHPRWIRLPGGGGLIASPTRRRRLNPRRANSVRFAAARRGLGDHDRRARPRRR